MKKTTKSVLIAIVVFAAVALAYFTPDIFQKKSLYQGDIVSGIGVNKEFSDYNEETGKRTLWTNNMFGGMPTYQLAPSYPSNDVFYNKLATIVSYVIPAPAFILFFLALGAFLLFIALGARVEIAVVGAFAYAFSSYFPILIHAGHIWKVLTLMYIPPTFAGIIWAYKGKYLLGGVVAALFTAMQIAQNHVQMTYYFGLLVLIYVIFEFFYSVKNKKITDFIKASSVLILAGIIGIAVNSTNLYHSYQYAEQTMRGPSDLVETGDKKVQTKGGLDKDYATQWSYGIGETFSLLIPDIKGGSSKPLQYTAQKDASAINKADPRTKENLMQFPRYWGNQPFTEGPVYAGAFIMFLFVLGLFIVKGKMKWTLLTATILSILLAWGHNFMWLTSLFLDHFPLYNKFRAVSSILVIAELTIPTLAVLTLMELVKNPNIIFEKKKEFYISLASTAGVALLFIIFPNIFALTSKMENEMFTQAMANPQQAGFVQLLISSLESVRMHILRADALRSLFIILVGVALIYAMAKKYIKSTVAICLIALLVLLDMSLVDKRYLNSSSFHPIKEISKDVFPETNADRQILMDTSYYRVLNLTSDTYQEAATSYRHKSIGGYSAAKLRRYQDIITQHLPKGRENRNVLNMLNTKYVIADSNNANINPGALGNAWFVNQIQWVENANQEIDALTAFNPSSVAIADQRFKTSELVNIQNTQEDSTAYINLMEYQPNYLKYETNSDIDKLAVFSEIYYPHGWHVQIDGKPTEYLRVNYILRAAYIPKGKHVVEFSFHPSTYTSTETIAYIAGILIFLSLFALIAVECIKCWKKKNKVIVK